MEFVSTITPTKVNFKAERMQSVTNVMHSVSERAVVDYKTEMLDEYSFKGSRAN